MDLGDFEKFRIALDEVISPSARHCNPFARADDTTELLQLALGSAGVGVWEIDLLTNVLNVCPQGLLIFGLPDDHSHVLTQEEWLKLIDVRDIEQIQQWAGNQTPFPASRTREFRIQRPDGETRWLRTSSRVLRDRNGRPRRLFGLLFDDTERKRAEVEVRQSEERLHLTQEAALIGTFTTSDDLKTIGSRQFYRNLGLPDDGGLIERVDNGNFVHPDDLERVEREMLLAFEMAEGFDSTFRIIRADTGELRWIFARVKFERSEDGRSVRMLGAHLDITDRHKAEEAVRENEERLRLIQESALIGTFTIEGGGRVVGSRQFFRNLGLPDDTMSIGRNEIFGLLYPDDREWVIRASLGVVDFEVDRQDIEFRINRADTGEVRWIFSRIGRVRAEDGQVIRVIGVHIDITEARRAAAALQESRAFGDSVMKASADCVKVIDLDGSLLFMNEQGISALEIEDITKLLGNSWTDLLPPAERPKVEAAIQAALGGQTGRFHAGCPTVTGKPKWWDVVVTPICDEQGRPRQLLAISRDITEHRDNLAQIRWTASHDMLTELPNRRYFQDQLEKAIARAAEKGSNVGLLQLDVDDFKQVNDALGHDAGDALLKDFTQRLLRAARQNETVARLGGDEFAIIIPNLTDKRPLSGIVEDIKAQLAAPFVYQGSVFDCRASIGEAIYPQHGKSPEALLKSADIALYAAKISGPGHVRLFDPAMRSGMQKRLDMVTRARKALHDDRIFPFYQPKIHFGTGAPAGFEALLRWQDGDKKIQHPGAIAAAFEDLDVAQALSERMQLRVLADIRRWLDDGVDFGHVAINASAAEFRQNDFAERLLNRINAAGVPTRYIELEVTETVFLGRGADHVERALHLLSSEGIRIALDDFGTGYASLSHLKQFPVDIIKIDQSFVRNINVDPDDSAIIKALIGLGKSLSIDIVAEGVETYAQSAFLADQGCDYGQGYLFSKAVGATEVSELISKLEKGPARYQLDTRIYSI